MGDGPLVSSQERRDRLAAAKNEEPPVVLADPEIIRGLELGINERSCPGRPAPPRSAATRPARPSLAPHRPAPLRLAPPMVYPGLGLGKYDLTCLRLSRNV